MNCNTCKMCESADKRLESFVASKAGEFETAFQRTIDQKVKCGFGLQGVCCRLCSNGPCRVTPKSPRGICGADADTIVARNFLRAVSAGAACYLHVVENTALNVKHVGENNGVIKSEKALNILGEELGIFDDDPHKRCVKIADAILKDLYKPRYEKMELVEKLAYHMRVDKWKELGIMPGGAKSEVFDGCVKSSTNLSSDPVDMLMHCLSLGICTGLYGLTLTNLLNDIVLGDPVIRMAPVGFRVIDEDYINIMVTGHQHSTFASFQEKIKLPEVVEVAKSVGAKGFRLVGCTCVGQDLQLRGEHYKEIFAGHAGNNYTSEAVLATGAVDMVVSEFNCTIPGLEPIADKLQVKMICLDDVAKKKNAELIQLDRDKFDEIDHRLINEAVEAYKERRGNVTIDIPKDHGYDESLTGVSEKNLKEFLGGNWKPLIDLIADGTIKGVVGVVGCSNMTAGGHDVHTVELVKELIKKDILVLSAGCSTGGLENVGLMSPGAEELAGENLKAVCKKLNIPPVLNFGPCLAIGRIEIVVSELAAALNVDIPQLPVALSAPQWLEEQALADGAFGLALGLPLHLALPPFITGGPLVTQVLTEGLKGITGGSVIVDPDPESAANTLEAEILDRRKGLGLK